MGCLGTKQRLVIALLDGLGMDYFETGPMPVLQRMCRDGFYRPVRAVVRDDAHGIVFPDAQQAQAASYIVHAFPEIGKGYPVVLF